MGRIKCFSNVECQICHTKGMLQIFFNSYGKIKYARIRHYEGIVNGKPKFHYCKQPNEYANQILNDQNHDQNVNNVDLKLLNNGSISENVRAGSLARLGHPLDVRKVTGSNPVRPTKKTLHAFYEVFNFFSFRLFHG